MDMTDSGWPLKGKADQHDTAQVCPNGHVSNDSMQTHTHANEDYCSKCGEPTLSECPNFRAPIRGAYYDRWGARDSYSLPGYCFKCGKQFPWTERRITAAIQMLADSGDLESVDAEQFKSSLDAVARETAEAELGASWLKRLLGKMPDAGREALKRTLYGVLTEAAKRQIFGPP